MCASPIVKKDNVGAILKRALDAGDGLLRLTPTWVPRSFLHPGKRIKLAPTDWYAYGAHRGGIDERWFASTTEAANDNRTPDEGLSYCRLRGPAFPAPRRRGRSRRAAHRQGRCSTSTNAGRSTRSSSTTWAPSRIHMHQSVEARRADRAAGQAGKLLLPAAVEQRRQQFRLHVHGPRAGHDQGRHPQLPGKLEPRATTASSDLSQGAYRLKRGTGWLIPPGVLHAPGSLCTYEPQWGSDVFGMFQSLVEGREVPWSLLVKDMPQGQAPRPGLHHRAARLGEERRHPLQGAQLPGADRRPGSPAGRATPTAGSSTARSTASRTFRAKELTVEAGGEMHCSAIRAPAAGSPCKAAGGSAGSTLQTPAMIHFGEETEDEVFITHEAADGRRRDRKHRQRAAGGPAVLRAGCA